MDPARVDIPLSPSEFRDAALAHLDSVHRLASHFARDTAEADDLVQETYLRAFQAAATYRTDPTGMRAWLFRIMKNVLFADRRHKRHESMRDEFAERTAAASRPTENARLSDLDWEDVEQSLKAAVLSLPESLRLVFLMFAVEDMKYREIAEALEIPLGTVMSRLNRARRQLVARLAGKTASSMNNPPPQRIGIRNRD